MDTNKTEIHENLYKVDSGTAKYIDEAKDVGYHPESHFEKVKTSLQASKEHPIGTEESKQVFKDPKDEPKHKKRSNKTDEKGVSWVDVVEHGTESRETAQSVNKNLQKKERSKTKKQSNKKQKIGETKEEEDEEREDEDQEEEEEENRQRQEEDELKSEIQNEEELPTKERQLEEKEEPKKEET